MFKFLKKAFNSLFAPARKAVAAATLAAAVPAAFANTPVPDPEPVVDTTHLSVPQSRDEKLQSLITALRAAGPAAPNRLLTAAENGNTQAIKDLAVGVYNGTQGFVKNQASGIALFEIAAERGHKGAQRDLKWIASLQKKTGPVVRAEPQPEQTVEAKAAPASPSAELSAAVTDIKTKLKTDMSWTNSSALQGMLSRAESGDWKAINSIGWGFSKGALGLPQDADYAKKWHELGAKAAPPATKDPEILTAVASASVSIKTSLKTQGTDSVALRKMLARAEGGDLKAMNDISYGLRNGRLGLWQDQAAAQAWQDFASGTVSPENDQVVEPAPAAIATAPLIASGVLAGTCEDINVQNTGDKIIIDSVCDNENDEMEPTDIYLLKTRMGQTYPYIWNGPGRVLTEEFRSSSLMDLIESRLIPDALAAPATAAAAPSFGQR